MLHAGKASFAHSQSAAMSWLVFLVTTHGGKDGKRRPDSGVSNVKCQFGRKDDKFFNGADTFIEDPDSWFRPLEMAEGRFKQVW